MEIYIYLNICQKLILQGVWFEIVVTEKGITFVFYKCLIAPPFSLLPNLHWEKVKLPLEEGGLGNINLKTEKFFLIVQMDLEISS